MCSQWNCSRAKACLHFQWREYLQELKIKPLKCRRKKVKFLHWLHTVPHFFFFFFPQLAKQPFDLPHYYPNATFCFFPTYWTPLDTSSTWILDRSTEFAPLLTHNIKENKSKQQKLLEENTPKLGYVYIFKRHSIIYCKLKQYSNLFFFTFIHLRKQILKKKIIMRWITTLGSINPKR